MVDGVSGGPDLSVLRLGQIRFFVAVFVSALFMKGLSCEGAVVFTSQLTDLLTPLLPLRLNCTIS